jgi:hypothetical protein
MDEERLIKLIELSTAEDVPGRTGGGVAQFSPDRINGLFATVCLKGMLGRLPEASGQAC